MSLQETKKSLLKAAQDDKAEFIKEEATSGNVYIQTYKYEGYTFTISASGPERWLSSAELINITEEPVHETKHFAAYDTETLHVFTDTISFTRLQAIEKFAGIYGAGSWLKEPNYEVSEIRITLIES